MQLDLYRYDFQDDRTIGLLYINGVYFSDTLEDRYRDLSVEEKVPNKTCIPCGEYNITLVNSPRFKRILPLLSNVPKFTGILIHSGNTPDDTSGCILVGQRNGNIISNSRLTENKLLEILKNEKNITVNITNNPIINFLQSY